MQRLEHSGGEHSVLQSSGGGPLHFVLGDGPQGDPADIHVGIAHRLRELCRRQRLFCFECQRQDSAARVNILTGQTANRFRRQDFVGIINPVLAVVTAFDLAPRNITLGTLGGKFPRLRKTVSRTGDCCSRIFAMRRAMTASDAGVNKSISSTTSPFSQSSTDQRKFPAVCTPPLTFHCIGFSG